LPVFSPMASLAQDLRYALRQLRLSPVFTFTALLTLALGIGSATAVFSVVEGVLLRPFAFREPGRLVVWRETIQEVSNRYPLLPDNYRHYLYLKSHSSKISDAAILQNASFAVSVGNGHPQMINGLSVSTNLFSLLGVKPIVGRTFLPEESKQGRSDAVLISWSAWNQLFNGDPNVIGRFLRVAGSPKAVVGVLPKSFSLPRLSEMPGSPAAGPVSPYEIFQPLVPKGEELTSDDGEFGFLVIARLKPGVSAADASSELNAMQKAYSGNNRLQIHLGAVVEPLAEEVTGNIKKALWMLLAAVSGVLLIASVNLAGLQLARSVAHDHDNALRMALGADSRQLLRSSFVESFALATCGGIAGILIAFWGIRLLLSIAPPGLPRLNDVHLSLPVLLFALSTTLLTAFIFGTLPGFRLLRTNPQEVLQKWSSRISDSRGTQSARNLLVAFEIACTVMLLIFTALMTRSLNQVLSQARIFNADHVVVAQANLLGPSYTSGENGGARARSAFVDRALDRLRTTPGIQSAAITSSMPFTGENDVHNIFRQENPLPESKAPVANLRNISPEYFAALHIPLLSGKPFSPQEKDQPVHAIVSQSAANATWPGLNPVGRAFKIVGALYTVAGVAADTHIADLKKEIPVVYLPYWHEPPSTVFFIVRSSQAVGPLASAVRRELWDIDPEVALPVIQSLDSQVNESVAPERFQTILLSSFGIAALILSLIGIYGIIAYSVSLRMQEFGIRLALGSQRATLVALVLTRGLYPVLAGLALGILGAAGATRMVRSLLYGTSSFDPLSVVISVAVLLLTALVAGLLPAYRAANVDVVKTLHQS